MTTLPIEIRQGKKVLRFEAIDYPHSENDRCKFEVFYKEKLQASFEPDKYGHLHPCKNPGHIDKATLHTIAEILESYNL